jgi:hypothetical protein
MRPQPWRRAMTDERPVRNEMACPKDFNSAVTDKTHAPFALTTHVRDREDSPKVRAGGSPFGFVEGNSERHDAGNRWVSIYTKLAAVWHPAISRCKAEETMRLLRLCKPFHISWIISALHTVTYCNERGFAETSTASALHYQGRLEKVCLFALKMRIV